MRTVKIREWDDMAEEFGLNELGNIKTIDRFVTDMKKYCGKTITLNDNMRYEFWAFSEQMFEIEGETRTVKIRSWESMAEEFGVTSFGYIKTRPSFNADMKKYCGETINLSADLRYESWYFSEQMFEIEGETRTVKIRSWESMAEEFGFTRHGNINTAPPFVHDMREHCGETITVDELLCYDTWEFSEEMFEPEEGKLKLTNHAANINAIDEIIKSYGEAIAKVEKTEKEYNHLKAELTNAKEEITSLKQSRERERQHRRTVSNNLEHQIGLTLKAEAEAQRYRKALVQIEAKGLGATAGYICSSIAETALKQGDKA